MPLGKPFLKTNSASLTANFAAKVKSGLGAYVASEIAIDGIPSIVPSVAAETVPE